MAVARYALARLAGLVGTLWVTSLLVFGATHAAPGSPEEFLLRGRAPTPEALAVVRTQYHLDEPLIEQYLRWAGGVLTGDFGRSLQFRQDVAGLIGARLTTTMWLVGYSALLIVVVGLMVGIVGALRPGPLDRTLLVGTTVAAATPSFVAVIGLSAVFSVGLGLLPAYGNGEGFAGRLTHLTLPAVALALGTIGLLARVTRSAMLAELSRDHVEVARGRGLPGHAVIRRHVLRNAAGPITAITGLIIAGTFVTTAVVEIGFGLSGLGSLLVQSVIAKDFPVVQAVCLLVVVAFVLVNLLVDLVGPLLDPRVGSTWAKRGPR
ncbi:MAG: ABC transporter permease [Actinomycetota bacterium]|nr:ABC transporter permease [Actinomycetota bacterium]